MHSTSKTTSKTLLILELPLGTFLRWGLDFVRPIKPTTKYALNRYILVIMDYIARWIEARAWCTNMVVVTMKFLHDNVIAHFGCPLELISYQGMHFVNDIIT